MKRNLFVSLASLFILTQHAFAQPTSVTAFSLYPDGTAGVNGQVFGVVANNDGSVLAYTTNRAIDTADTEGFHDVYVVDTPAGTTSRVSVSSAGVPGNGHSGGTEYGLDISADGRYVVYASEASNLVSGDTNGTFDIFLYDRQTQTTERVSVTSAGAQGPNPSTAPTISSDGTKIAFLSSSRLDAADLDSSVDVYIRDRTLGTTTLASPQALSADEPAISANGRFVVYNTFSKGVDNDTNGKNDVYRFDTFTQQTAHVSTGANGEIGGQNCRFGAMSADGRYVVFTGLASNLFSGDTNGQADVFVKDMDTGALEVISVSPTGSLGNGPSGNSQPSISLDGRYVVFESMATNLVNGVTSDLGQVFFRDRTLQKTYILSMKVGGEQPNGLAFTHPKALSGDAKSVVFLSESTNIDPNDTNDFRDAYVARFGVPSGGILTSKTKVASPTVVVNSKEATVTLQGFDRAEHKNKVLKFRYEVTLTSSKPKKKITKTTSKPTITFKKLKAAKYSASYRAQGVSGKSVKFETRSSTAVKFTIAK